MRTKFVFNVRHLTLGVLLVGTWLIGVQRPDQAVTKNNLSTVLSSYAGSSVPGLQYLVVDANAVRYAYAGGWANIAKKIPMTLETTMMAYSMTKTLTALAILQLVERGTLRLDDKLDRYVPDTPYAGHQITIRQLLTHTSGLPNPIPIRWAHLIEEDSSFDEAAALAEVMRDHPKLDFEPGQKFAYSNIGYWLLGKVIEKLTAQPYTAYLKANVLARLPLEAREMDFAITDNRNHASGYLARFSLLNLIKGFVMDKKFFAGHEGNWVRLNSHQLNGPAFGGLIGTAQGFAVFLQDQLRPQSRLLNTETKKRLETQQTDAQGQPVPMTLGWHIGKTQGIPYFFKEGGGGGFHAEMRLYPSKGIASVVMVNATEFKSHEFLNRLDRGFLLEPGQQP